MIDITKKNLRAVIPRYFYDKGLPIVVRSDALISSKKNTFGKNSAGFTLIEVVVVMAIIGIMASLVVASFGGGRTGKELETSAREFVGVMREAQNYALTGKRLTIPGIGVTDPCRFQVVWTTGSSNYELWYWYKNASGTLCSQSSRINTYTLKNGATFNGGSDLFFTLPYANTGLATGAKKAVTLGKDGFSHTVCIYADGRMSDQAGSGCP